MKKYEKRYTKMVVSPENEPLFSEMAFEVEIVDEAAGELVTVKSLAGIAQPSLIEITPEEWPHLKDAIQEMIDNCREDAP